MRRMAAAGRPAPDDLTDEPARLAEAARLHLREKFLRAKVGVSGANFAVADSGTLVVVESEGNGRMCLTLPEVLVSVVGIEKVVPTWSDLDVFLQLLPRSSTGERMNPYTSTWSGVTPGDGPQEVHVVLLDNGRTRALADEVGRQALRCIRCSACLNVCPVYERTGGHAYGSVYPGPIGAILNPLLRGPGHDEQTDSLPYASSLCGACFEVCPVRIDIPSVLVDLRAQVVDAHRPVPQARGPGHEGGRPGVRLGRAARARPRRPPASSAGCSGSRGAHPARRPSPAVAAARTRGAVDRRPGPAAAAGRVVPGLVEAHPEAPMTDARDEILGAYDGRWPPPTSRPCTSRAATAARGPADVDLFAERVADYRAVVVRCGASTRSRPGSPRPCRRTPGSWSPTGCRGTSPAPYPTTG